MEGERLDGFREFLKAQRVRIRHRLASAQGKVTKARHEAVRDGWMDQAPVSVARGRGSKKPGLDFYDSRGW